MMAQEENRDCSLFTITGKTDQLDKNQFKVFSIKIDSDSEKQKKLKYLPIFPPGLFHSDTAKSKSFIPNFSISLPPINAEGWGNEGLSSSHTISLCFSFLLPVFPCINVGIFCGLLSFRINLLQSHLSMWSKKYTPTPVCVPPRPARMILTPPSSLTLVPKTFFLLTFHCPLLFLSFLNVFPDTPSAWLISGAMSCGGCDAELSGSGHVQHGAVPGLCLGGTPMWLLPLPTPGHRQPMSCTQSLMLPADLHLLQEEYCKADALVKKDWYEHQRH